MIPHIWKRNGNWHCGVPIIEDGLRIVWWPRGVGDSAVAAYADYAKRAKEWA